MYQENIDQEMQAIDQQSNLNNKSYVNYIKTESILCSLSLGFRMLEHYNHKDQSKGYCMFETTLASMLVDIIADTKPKYQVKLKKQQNKEEKHKHTLESFLSMINETN